MVGGAVCTEPHSTMAIEYMVDWALETDGETIAHTLGPVEEAGAQSMSDVFGAGRDAFVEMARTHQLPGARPPGRARRR